MKSPARSLKTVLIVIAVMTITFSGFFIFSSMVLQRIYDEDIPKIVKLTLERALVEGELPAYSFIKDNESIIFSTKNINLSLMPKLDGVNFTFLSQNEIQEKANQDGDFLYLRFNEVKMETYMMSVSLVNTWAVKENSTMGHLSGGGFKIEYTKDFLGTINSKLVTWWIS
jgi:hypothetical protein